MTTIAMVVFDCKSACQQADLAKFKLLLKKGLRQCLKKKRKEKKTQKVQ